VQIWYFFLAVFFSCIFFVLVALRGSRGKTFSKYCRWIFLFFPLFLIYIYMVPDRGACARVLPADISGPPLPPWLAWSEVCVSVKRDLVWGNSIKPSSCTMRQCQKRPSMRQKRPNIELMRPATTIRMCRMTKKKKVAYLDGQGGKTSAPWLSQCIWQFHQTKFVHDASVSKET